MDALDQQLLALLVQDGRRSLDDMAARVQLAPSSVKRRIDRLRARGVIRGYTAVIDHAALGASTEALIELFYAPGVLLDEVSRRLSRFPEVVEAWSVTGEADAIARVRTRDNSDLERLIVDLQRDGSVVRTRTQIILSPLALRATDPAGGV